MPTAPREGWLLAWLALADLGQHAAVAGRRGAVQRASADRQDRRRGWPRFETIRVLSQETGADIKELEQTLLNLGQRGVYGPKEIVEAMKTMSLAGVSAKDITTSMKDVINLAVAGTTSLKAASDVLTAVCWL